LYGRFEGDEDSNSYEGCYSDFAEDSHLRRLF